MKIAVISDTHGLFRQQVRKLIESCDAVIHAGDITSQKVLEEIRSSGGTQVPFYVVRGNNDRAWAGNLPERLFFELDGTPFFLVHNKKDIPSDLGNTRIVIYGHSHKYAAEEKDGRLWLNPGSCGKSRFRQPVTMALLTLEHGKWLVERIDLPSGTESDNAGWERNLSAENMLSVIQEIQIRMDKGQTVDGIGKKMKLNRDFVEEICRIRVTHPGVTAEGILNKMEVNRVVTYSSEIKP